MDNQVTTPIIDEPVKLMKGKYDGRRNNGGHHRKSVDRGVGNRKPKWKRHLDKNMAAHELKLCDAYKAPSQMFIEAIEAKSYALAWEIRTGLENRAFGRPYVQVNPAEKERHNEGDVNRIAVAIKNLQIVQTSELPAATKNTLAPAITNLALPAIETNPAELSGDPDESS